MRYIDSTKVTHSTTNKREILLYIQETKNSIIRIVICLSYITSASGICNKNIDWSSNKKKKKFSLFLLFGWWPSFDVSNICVIVNRVYNFDLYTLFYYGYILRNVEYHWWPITLYTIVYCYAIVRLYRMYNIHTY